MKNSPQLVGSEEWCKVLTDDSFEGRVHYPRLWYDDICLHGFHYDSIDDFYSVWERRRNRYNAHNIKVIKVLYSDYDVERFEMLTVKKKVGFYYKQTNNPNIITLDNYNVQKMPICRGKKLIHLFVAERYSVDLMYLIF